MLEDLRGGMCGAEKDGEFSADAGIDSGGAESNYSAEGCLHSDVLT